TVSVGAVKGCAAGSASLLASGEAEDSAVGAVTSVTTRPVVVVLPFRSWLTPKNVAVTMIAAKIASARTRFRVFGVDAVRTMPASVVAPVASTGARLGDAPFTPVLDRGT